MTDYYVLHSGGLDSTTALAVTLQRPDVRNVYAVGVNYGQRHIKELEQAKILREHYEVESFTLDLTGYGESVTSALTSNDLDVPDGHYASDNMQITVVPGRNAVMLSAAAGLAASHTTDGEPITLVAAVHAGDHFIYHDCRPEFIDAIDTALSAGVGVSVWAPFVAMTKTEIVKLGHSVGAPLHLTWSCYKGGDKHCGTCGTCVERREAFTDAGVPDQTEYDA